MLSKISHLTCTFVSFSVVLHGGNDVSTPDSDNFRSHNYQMTRFYFATVGTKLCNSILLSVNVVLRNVVQISNFCVRRTFASIKNKSDAMWYWMFNGLRVWNNSTLLLSLSLSIALSLSLSFYLSLSLSLFIFHSLPLTLLTILTSLHLAYLIQQN